MKKKRMRFRVDGKIFVIFIFFGSVMSTLGYTLFNNFLQINKLNSEKKFIEDNINSLKDEEASLEADIQKLSDSSYIARYAREKYLYSKDGELIIRMHD